MLTQIGKHNLSHIWTGQGTSYPPDFSQGYSWTMVYPAEGSLEAIGEGLLRWLEDWNPAEP
jgi:hypothetical protein